MEGGRERGGRKRKYGTRELGRDEGSILSLTDGIGRVSKHSHCTSHLHSDLNTKSAKARKLVRRDHIVDRICMDKRGVKEFDIMRGVLTVCVLHH